MSTLTNMLFAVSFRPAAAFASRRCHPVIPTNPSRRGKQLTRAAAISLQPRTAEACLARGVYTQWYHGGRLISPTEQCNRQFSFGTSGHSLIFGYVVTRFEFMTLASGIKRRNREK